MTIAFPCENCGHRYELDSSLAGRRGKCKKCDHVFVIPVPQQTRRPEVAVKTAAPASKPRKAPAPAKVDEYYGDDPYGFDEELSPPKGSLRPVAAADDDEFLPPRAAKPVEPKKKKKRRSGGGDGFSMDDLPFAVFKYGMFAVLGTLFLYVFGMRVGVVATLGVFGLVTFAMYAIGAIGMLVVPFQESAVCGLMNLFVPFYSLYYLMTRWDAMSRWFLTSLTALGMFFVLAFGAGVLLPAIVPKEAIEAAIRKQQQLEQQNRLRMLQQPGGVPQEDDEPARPFAANPADDIPEEGRFGPGVAVNPTPKRPAPPQFDNGIMGGGQRILAPPRFEGPPGIPAPPSFRNRNAARPNVAAPPNDPGAMAGGPNADNPPPRKTLSERRRLAMAPSSNKDVGKARGNPGAVQQGREAFLDEAIRDLHSLNLDDRSRALKKLQSAPPLEDRREEVAAAIEPMLTDPNGWGRMDAAKALGVWGGPENTPALVKALKDPDFAVRWAVLDALKELKDPAAAEGVAEMLTKDRQKASDALKAMGPDAEPAVIPYLKSSDLFVRVEACKILQEIGAGDEAKSAIFEMGRRANGQNLDGMAAKAALDVLGYPKTTPTRRKSIVPSTSKRR